jgi:hypothetical protein
MFPTEIVAKRIVALGADIRSAWRSLAAAMRMRRQRGERERYFAGSADRFELERRERAWTRAHYSDGSLLGR